MLDPSRPGEAVADGQIVELLGDAAEAAARLAFCDHCVGKATFGLRDGGAAIEWLSGKHGMMDGNSGGDPAVEERGIGGGRKAAVGSVGERGGDLLVGAELRSEAATVVECSIGDGGGVPRVGRLP